MHRTYMLRVLLEVRVLGLETREPLDFSIFTERDQLRFDGPLSIGGGAQTSEWVLKFQAIARRADTLIFMFVNGHILRCFCMHEQFYGSLGDKVRTLTVACFFNLYFWARSGGAGNSAVWKEDDHFFLPEEFSSRQVPSLSAGNN